MGMSSGAEHGMLYDRFFFHISRSNVITNKIMSNLYKFNVYTSQNKRLKNLETQPLQQSAVSQFVNKIYIYNYPVQLVTAYFEDNVMIKKL